MGIQGIPYTFHTKQHPEREGDVVFRHWNSDKTPINIKHRFIFEDNDSQPWHNAEYHFPNGIESQDFQSRIRGRSLLRTFDTDVISVIQSRRLGSSTTEILAKKVTLKVWRRTNTTITFFATFDTVKHQRHQQIYIYCFRKEAELRGGRKLVLKFNRQQEVDDQHMPPETQHKRKLSFTSITSKGKRAKSEDQSIRKLSIPENSSLPSSRIHDSELQTDDSIEKNWEALEIQFTHDGGQSELFYIER